MSELVPPDFGRCQCEITKSNPWVMGGSVRTTVRCHSEPIWLAVEIKPGPDGKHGSMALCHECAIKLMENAELRGNIQLQPITRDQEPIA